MIHKDIFARNRVRQWFAKDDYLGEVIENAISFKLDTLAFAKATRADGDLSGIRHLPRVIAVGGGRIIEGAGAVVGAIGVSGAPGGEADDVCARAGIAAIQDDLDF